MIPQSLVDILNSDLNDNDDEGAVAPTLFEISPYYDNQNAIELLKTKTNTLTLLSLNCQSLNSKFTQLETYVRDLDNSEFKFSLICLQETWLSDDCDASLFQLEGYNFEYKPKRCSTHGGVGIYIGESIEYTVLPFDSNANIWDGIFIEIGVNLGNSQHKKRIILGNIYRPPRENSENYRIFNEEIQQILSQYSNSNAEFILTGDFNIDLLKMHQRENVNEFMEMLLSHGLLPKITLPTRLAQTCETLIDNCFVKLSVNFAKTTSGILLSNISDHQPYFVAFDFLKLTKDKVKYVKVFKNTPEAKLGFKAELGNLCSMSLFKMGSHDDPNKNYEILNGIVQTALDKHMPIKHVKYKKHKHKKSDWITSGIIRSIKFRDKLYQRLRVTPITDAIYNTLKTNLRTYNCILKQSIRKAKINYYKSSFQKYKNDMKSTWNIIKEIINKSNSKSDYPEKFIINDLEVNDPKIIADGFNKFFIDIGPKLAGKIRTASNFEQYLKATVTSTFQFENITEETIHGIIRNLKPKTSFGWDRISNKLLKYVANELVPFLTLILNQTLNTGIFPNKLKVAKVLPIFKKDDSMKFENYRPVSVLPSVSKVFERVIHNQLYSYFDINNLLYNSQYGFRCQHSTELAALETLDRIIDAMDMDKIPLNIYLDLSKAFDTLDHNILIKKLKYYGLQGVSVKLLENYLDNRYQYVIFGETKSDLLKISTGVPQGSILGPLLFIVYLNDVVESCNMFTPVIYADDTALFSVLEVFGPNSQDIETNINHELISIGNWFKANKLSINGSKTKAMLFHMANRHVTYPCLQLDGINIQFVKEFNYLGINFDSNITWKSHAQKMINKISRTCGVMNKLKHYLPSDILKTLYNSLVFPYLNYGIIVWGIAASKLNKLQKKAIRIVSGATYNAHTQPLFKKLELLTIEDIKKLQDLKFIFKYENNSLPDYFLFTMFVRQDEIHRYNTRQASHYRVPQSRHVFVRNSVRHRLPMVFNNCPVNIKEKVYTHSYQGFVRYVRKCFIDDYENTCAIQNCYICQRVG